MPQVALMEIARGFELPVRITNAGDGSGRLFVVEQKGRIRIIKDGAVIPLFWTFRSESVVAESGVCSTSLSLRVMLPRAFLRKLHRR